MDELLLVKDMSDSQRHLFLSETAKVYKNRTTALLLTLFFGGMGAHRFYLGEVGLGVVYLIFCWTFIPLLISFVELFLVMKRVDRYNEHKAEEIAMKIRLLTSR